MRPRARPAALLATVVITAAAAAPASSQDLEVYGSYSRSDLREIGESNGLGVSMRIVELLGATVRISYHWHQETTERTGRVCNNYPAGFRCNEEGISTRTRLLGLAAMGVWRHRPLPSIELELGGGVSMNTVNGSERTESGRPSDLFTYSTGHSGLLVVARTRARPVRNMPFTVNISLVNHRLLLRACARDEPFMYAPYCGPTDLRELRIGIGYDTAW
jgi:hypothetical protein